MAKSKVLPSEVETIRKRRNELLLLTNPQTRDKSASREQIGAWYDELIQVQMDLIEAMSIEGTPSIRRVKYGD